MFHFHIHFQQQYQCRPVIFRFSNLFYSYSCGMWRLQIIWISKTKFFHPTKDGKYMLKSIIYIMIDLDLDRIESMAKKDAFIHLKDHNYNFTNNPTYRFQPWLNQKRPYKKKLGNHHHICETSHTCKPINWFKSIENKCNCIIIFDTMDFYPNISSSLLKKLLNC